MFLNNATNLWDIAEAYKAGALTPAEQQKLQNRIAADPAFAAEFNEIVNLIASLQGSGKQKQFAGMLQDIHAELEDNSKTAPKSRLLVFTPQFWRTTSVAATVAILASSLTYWSLTPSIKKNYSQYSTISREVAHIKKVQAQQKAEQDKMKQDITKNQLPAPPPSDVRYTGTGFALTNDGYFVTANHVIHHPGNEEFDSVYIQNQEGQYFKAKLVSFDKEADIALLKVDKKNFHFTKGDLPYAIAHTKSGLGTKIYTIGFPKENIVYGEGYISARCGYEGNDHQYTLDLPAGRGQSGSPVMDDKGNVLGLLAATGTEDVASTYAISSKALLEFLDNDEDLDLHLPKSNKLARLSREQQIEKMQNYTFSVKVYKK